jgi:hypothetical protein
MNDADDAVVVVVVVVENHEITSSLLYPFDAAIALKLPSNCF